MVWAIQRGIHVGYCTETVENTAWMKLCLIIDHDQMVRLRALETMCVEGSMDYSKTSDIVDLQDWGKI